jgi:NAD-dependent deacetylase
VASLVVLTGAGISAESGLATFRADDGLWCGHRVEDVATPEGFEANPELVHDFYNQRRRQLKDVTPNAAHLALAELAAWWEGQFLLVTQNVDDLHDRAHAQIAPKSGFKLIHMHGELLKARCLKTGALEPCTDDVSPNGTLRPHIVWFGEMPLAMDSIEAALATCDLFLSIGTSGNVYPAAGFVREAKRPGANKSYGARCVELNLEPSLGHSYFDAMILGPATKTVPEFVSGLMI